MSPNSPRRITVLVIFLLALAASLIFARWPQDSHAFSIENYQSLHAQFDEAFPGRGHVDYGQNEVEDIAKAYAMVLKAEIYRRKAEGIPELRSLESAAGNWLLDHKDEDSDGVVGWGVPLSWDAFGDGSPNPRNAEYTISTAISVDALLDWMESSKHAPRKRILAVISAAVEPYLNDRMLSPSGMFPYSLEEVDREYDVFNPAAYLAGQLQRTSGMIEDNKLAQRMRMFADYTVSSLIKFRKTDSSGDWYWSYSVQENNIPNDLAHAVYVMKGLSDYVRFGGKMSDQIPLEKVSGHLSKFFPEHGLYVHGWPVFRKDTHLPARSYGIGMAIYFANERHLRGKETNLLVKASKMYRTRDGGFAKYPHESIGELYQPTAKDHLVIQEYQSYMLLAQSSSLFHASKKAH